MKQDFYSLNDMALLYFQDIEYLISILNANEIKFEDYKDSIRYEEIMDTFHKCYEKCVELGYYVKE